VCYKYYDCLAELDPRDLNRRFSLENVKKLMLKRARRAKISRPERSRRSLSTRVRTCNSRWASPNSNYMKGRETRAFSSLSVAGSSADCVRHSTMTWLADSPKKSSGQSKLREYEADTIVRLRKSIRRPSKCIP
jgi:hypothetical protein